MRSVFLLSLALLFVGLPAVVTADPGDEFWVEGFGRVGANQPVNVLLSTPYGLVAGGEFDYMGESTSPHIALWNGSTWEDVGAGLDGPVHCATLFQGDLIVGGDFSHAGDLVVGNIARWDGEAWHRLSHGSASVVRALTIHNTRLIASGDFSGSAGQNATRIAMWDGSQWFALGNGLEDRFDRPPYALTVIGNLLVAGGYDAIAGYDGTAWADYFDLPGDHTSYEGSDAPITIYGLVVYQGQLHALGDFVKESGEEPPNENEYESIARWDGTQWQGLGCGVSGTPSVIPEDVAYAMAGIVDGDRLVVVGYFVSADGAGLVFGVAGWDGSAWHAYDLGVASWGGSPRTVALHDGELFVGGDFVLPYEPGGQSDFDLNHIARWDDVSWQRVGEMGNGLNGSVVAIQEYQGGLAIGGVFDLAGATPANCIALWSDGQWSTLGDGLTGSGITSVSALTLFEGDLIAGGDFDTAGSVPAINIARWDGTAWSAIGGGMPNQVYSLAVYDGELWANGFRFDGQDWVNEIQANDEVRTLQIWNGDLYAGGKFSESRGAPANKIVRWDGSDCYPLGESTRTSMRAQGVLALDIYQGDLLVAGSFYDVGGLTYNYLATWDGSQWHSLGDPLQGLSWYYGVYSVACIGDQLFVGGCFDQAGGLPVDKIARWDGAQWHDMGAGVSGSLPNAWPYVQSVWTMKTVGSTLVVGGTFDKAGDKPAHGLAMWRDPGVLSGVDIESDLPARTNRLSVYPNPFNPSTTVSYISLRVEKIQVAVYDLRGALVDVLYEGPGRIGRQDFPWRADDLASGVYFVKVTGRDEQAVDRAVLLK